MDPEIPNPSEFDGGPLRRDEQEDWAFSAARELRDWVRREVGQIEETREWTMTPSAIENLARGTFARGTKTFGAVLLLCDRGQETLYGAQSGEFSPPSDFGPSADISPSSEIGSDTGETDDGRGGFRTCDLSRVKRVRKGPRKRKKRL